ncbi:MAG: alpha-beta hydrolase superfamily lysophospholipase [Sphingobacteriales bacterium]|jgi:alpha-beta hydrolase superfamily lysophospholipase
MQYIIIGLVAIYGALCFSFYSFQEKFLFHPSKLEKDFQFSHKSFIKEYLLKDTGNVEISLAHFSASDSPKALVIYFHGNVHNIEHYSQFIDPFLENNLDVIIMDYRNFGKSQGKTTPNSFYNDINLVSDFIDKEFKHHKKVAYGKSLGSGMATYFASKQNTELIILEAPFYDFSNTVNRWGALFLSKTFLKYKFNNATNLKLSKAPVYIFHGENDWLISPKAPGKIKNEFHERVKLTIIKDGKHNGLPDFPIYKQTMDSILKGI